MGAVSNRARSDTLKEIETIDQSPESPVNSNLSASILALGSVSKSREPLNRSD